MILKFNVSNLVDVDVGDILKNYKSRIFEIFNSVKNGTSEGSEMTGWIEWVNRDHSDLIKKATELREFWLQRNVKKVVIVGTGGSYIGLKAALDFENSLFSSKNFDFIFVPYFSERYLVELENHLLNTKFAVLVISKSGTTLESAIAFRFLRELLYKSEGEDYIQFIAAITDKNKGVLRKIVNDRGISSFVIEDSIGGRYSTLTAVGIVPMILGGVDVFKVLEGAKQAYLENFHGDLLTNSSALYASIRHFLFSKKSLVTECFACYDPHLIFCLEKAKQLFSESEGKEGAGILPVVLNFTPDLHSVGQLLQEGNKSFFETILLVKKSKYDGFVKKSSFNNDDNLDWLSGKSFKEINDCAFEGTLEAHSKRGGVNNLVIELLSWSPESFGYLYFWLSMSAMYSSYLFEVNPFNQPGVEIYKKRMFQLLGQSS